MTKETDTALVRAFLAGSESAYGTFIDRHSRGLYRVAKLWLSDSSLAEDVVQETLLRSYTGLARFRFQAQPKTWLYRMCRNVCREMNRQQHRETITGETTALLERTQANQSNESEASMEMRHESSQLGQQMQLLLRQLPQRQKEVVVLRLLEDLSVKQTANIMACRQGTVKAHLAKALTNLRALLADSHER